MVERDDVDFELREIDERILDILEEGRCTRKHLADLLDVGGEYVYQRVDLMAKLGLVNVIHDGFYELSEDVGTDDDHESRAGESDQELSAEVVDPTQSEPPAVEELISSEAVDAVVERVSAGWEDTDERLEARRAAARAVLQHALDTGDAIGKSDAIEKFLPKHAVDGQGDETWWRKNIRPVLTEVGDYSPGKHGYVVQEGDADEFVEEKDG